MFPGPGAQIYRNESGEPLGWDYPDAYDPGDPGDPSDHDLSVADCAAEEAGERGQEDGEAGFERDSIYGTQRTNRSTQAAGWLQDSYDEGYEDGRTGAEEEP